MKEQSKTIYSILIRYFILIIVAFPSFWIFYFIFTPLTIYPVYIIINLFLEAELIGKLIILKNYIYSIEIINACIAGSAYYLLLILNLSVPNICKSKRIKMIGLAFVSFLIINILRIVLLSFIFILKPEIFDISHKLSWYFGSIILVIVIWFVEVKKFKVKGIPFYSDIKFISKQIK